jgi:hypothetical protein
MDRTLFGCERIDVGAHEASLLANVCLCRDTKFFFRERQDFWCIKLRGSLLGITLIPILFYTYNGVIGKSPDWINIAIFFISAAIAYILETRLFISGKLSCQKPKARLTVLCGIALLFILFTFRTPEIGIFKDPLTGKYGIGG